MPDKTKSVSISKNGKSLKICFKLNGPIMDWWVVRLEGDDEMELGEGSSRETPPPYECNIQYPAAGNVLVLKWIINIYGPSVSVNYQFDVWLEVDGTVVNGSLVSKSGRVDANNAVTEEEKYVVSI